MKMIHKICVIHADQPNNTTKVREMLRNTDYIVSEGYDNDGEYQFEVFEEIELEDIYPAPIPNRLNRKA